MATLKAEISKQYKKITGEDVTIVQIWDEEGYVLHGACARILAPRTHTVRPRCHF